MKMCSRWLSFLLLAALFGSGCAPIIPYAGDVAVPPIPADVSFAESQDADKRLLVLPVWKTYTGHIVEHKRTEFVYVIDDVLIVRASELHELHEIIPSRASYGVTGLSSAYAVDNDFLGMYLIADSGEAVLLARANLQWIEKEIAWRGVLDARIGEAWKRELTAVFGDAEQIDVDEVDGSSFWRAEFAIPCDFFLRATGLPEELCKKDVAQSFPGHPLQLELTPEERQAVVDFLRGIEVGQEPSVSPAWVPRNIYSP